MYCDILINAICRVFVLVRKPRDYHIHTVVNIYIASHRNESTSSLSIIITIIIIIIKIILRCIHYSS